MSIPPSNAQCFCNNYAKIGATIITKNIAKEPHSVYESEKDASDFTDMVTRKALIVLTAMQEKFCKLNSGSVASLNTQELPENFSTVDLNPLRALFKGCGMTITTHENLAQFEVTLNKDFQSLIASA